MKIYHFGAEDAPVLLLLPGTCCHWKSNFGAVIPLLADSFRVLCVSYDGFDETEPVSYTHLTGQRRTCRAGSRRRTGASRPTQRGTLVSVERQFGRKQTIGWLA